MGYWFGKFSKCYPWRKTPVKIGDTWYTPYGEVVRDPDAYFAAIKRNGRYWEGNTGWDKERFNSCEYEEDEDIDFEDMYDMDMAPYEDFEPDEIDYYRDEDEISSYYDPCDYDDFCDYDDYEYNQDIYNP